MVEVFRDDGGYERWLESNPNGFVVNCPAPLLAPNTYEPT